MGAIEEPPARQAARLRLIPSGRLAPTPRTWSQPLPPSLLGLVAEERRAEHSRLLDTWQAAETQVADLAAKTEKVRAEDERALRAAVGRGKKPPAPKAPAVEAELDAARRTLDTAGQLLSESGRNLLADLTDDDLQLAIRETRRRAQEIVEKLPEQPP